MVDNPDELPQPIGEFQPIDAWQRHINELFYGLRGGRLRDYYQTFTSGDYRLAHALAADYYARACRREEVRGERREARGRDQGQLTPSPLPLASSHVVLQLGAGNGNLAGCFLSHLKALDKDGLVYPRVRYVLVDPSEEILASARAHPALADHQELVEIAATPLDHVASIPDSSVDRMLCSEVWNELPTKLMLRNKGEVEEEYLRPNLSAARHDEIGDWSAFVRAFQTTDIPALRGYPPFLEDIIWEREYRKTDWAAVPYRKTITEFLKEVDEQVLVPINLGACATVKEAKRVLSRDAIGFSAFEAGAADRKVLNDPEKPCYGTFGGQYSFMLNFPLVEAVARHVGVGTVTLEPQREFVGRALGANVITVMDLLATHHRGATLKGWEQDRLILETVQALNETYRSPYRHRFEFPLRPDIPDQERGTMQALLTSLKPDGVPDTVAYLTEDEVLGALSQLETLGFDREAVQLAFRIPPQPVDYQHFLLRP
jgi:hypothetical protein